MQRLWLAAIVVVLSAHGLVAAADDFRLSSVAANLPPASVLEEELWSDADDGRLDQFSLLDAALIAGGVVTRHELNHYEQLTAKHLAELRDLTRTVNEPRRKVEIIFAFLHRRVLTGSYDLFCGDLRRTLDEGSYNCLTASVLMTYFCEGQGLRCEILEMPGHAMLRILLPEGPLDVETTSATWLERPDLLRTAEARKGLPAFPTVEVRQTARVVSPIQAAAMFYYNRGVTLLSAGKYAEAATANLKAFRLDPQNMLARGNLLATLNNWSIELGRQNRYAEAAELLREGLRLDNRHPVLTENLARLQSRWEEYRKHEVGTHTRLLREEPSSAAASSEQVSFFAEPKVD